MTRKHAAALGLSLVTLAAILAVAASVVWGYRQDGPIRFDGAAGVKWSVARATAFSWTMPLPPNPTSDDITIEAIDPVGIEGLEVLGVAVAYGCGLPTTITGYPPDRVMTRTVEGAMLLADADPCDVPTAVIGLRRVTGAASGAIDGLRLRYESSGTRYETVLALRLEVTEPES